MERIEPFWVGAARSGSGAVLARLAERLGSDRLEAATVADLVAVGVPVRRAEQWMAVRAARTEGRALRWGRPGYPERLLRVADAPAVLWVEGEPDCLRAERTVAIVGTRRCTPYGRSVARSLAAALARAGAVVISGLARGVDGAAHEGALDGGRTVAVLGHGLAHTAPPSHRRLRARIVAGGGAMVSTWPDAQEPARWTFPRRNRWVAALSDAVIVVEAPERSGALITAREAVDLAAEGDGQGPEVWVVPGRLGSPESAGCLGLIEEGVARVVSSVDGVVGELCGVRTRQQLDWVELVCAGASLEEVARLRGGSLLELVRDLTALELQGVLVRLPGQRYARAGSAPDNARSGRSSLAP